jgi:hypothetical protein
VSLVGRRWNEVYCTHESKGENHNSELQDIREILGVIVERMVTKQELNAVLDRMVTKEEFSALHREFVGFSSRNTAEFPRLREVSRVYVRKKSLNFTTFLAVFKYLEQKLGIESGK